MTELKNHQVDDWLRNPSPDISIVLVYGPDRGLVSERSTIFAKTTGINLDDTFSIIKVDVNDPEQGPGRVIEEARTISMFGGDRLIWVRASSAPAAFTEIVRDLLGDPPPDAKVVIEAGELKKSSKLRSLVERSDTGITLPCYGDDTYSLDRMIDAEITGNGMTIDLDARHLLKRSLGGDRIASRSEVEKLILYARDKESINVGDVAESVGDAAGLSHDEIVDAVLSGQPGPFDIAFSRMLRSGSPSFLCAAAAVRQLQSLQLIRATMDSGGKSAAAAVASSKPPVFFSRRKLVEKAASVLDGPFIVRALERMHEAVLRSRKYSELTDDIIRQSMLALALEIRAAGIRR